MLSWELVNLPLLMVVHCHIYLLDSLRMDRSLRSESWRLWGCQKCPWWYLYATLRTIPGPCLSPEDCKRCKECKWGFHLSPGGVAFFSRQFLDILARTMDSNSIISDSRKELDWVNECEHLTWQTLHKQQHSLSTRKHCALPRTKLLKNKGLNLFEWNPIIFSNGLCIHYYRSYTRKKCTQQLTHCFETYAWVENLMASLCGVNESIIGNRVAHLQTQNYSM